MMPHTRAPILRRLRADHLLLPISFVLVVLSAVLSFLNTRELAASTLELARLNRVIYANEALLAGLKDLETGQRGYLLTGESRYLQPVRNAVGTLPELLAGLSKEMGPDEQDLRQRLSVLIAQKRTDVEATITVRDRAGPDAALAILKSDSGRESTDAIRILCATINRQAADTLISDATALAGHQRNASLLSLSITFSLLIFLGLAVFTIQRGVHGRDQLIGQIDAARQHLQTTLASIGDGVAVTDADGVITYMNAVAIRISGWDAKAACGRKIEDVLRLRDEFRGVPVDHPVHQVMRDRGLGILPEPTILLRADGSEVPIDDTAAPILARDGHSLHGVVMVFRDVTERRLAETSIRKWEHVFEHAGLGMAILSPGDAPRLQQVNPAFAHMHGYAPADLAGRPLREVVSPDAWEAEAAGLRNAETTGHLITQTTHQRKDGTAFPTLADVTIVRDDAGLALYGTACYSDITARVNADDELRRNEARFRELADSLPQLAWTCLPDGTPDYFNSRWKEAAGLDMGATEGQGWHYFLHPADKENFQLEWQGALSQQTAFQTECRLGRTEAYRWHICRATPVRGADGKVIRWFGTCTDIHDGREVANALRVSKEELQRSNLDLEQFAYAASHDLQEPLRMIVIYAQLLQEEFGAGLAERGKTYLKFAVDGALRMESLIKGLLIYSRASGPAGVAPEGTALNDAVTTALTNLTGQVQQSHASVTCGPLPRLDVPEIHLTLVFQNLISNALKYTRPGCDPVVTITATEQPGEWLFSVRDNGLGIDPQYHDQIFRVFRRLHGADYPGTGIGLALCQRLIERSGGRIWVEPNTGEGAETGSTFCFTLPARKSEIT